MAVENFLICRILSYAILFGFMSCLVVFLLNGFYFLCESLIFRFYGFVLGLSVDSGTLRKCWLSVFRLSCGQTFKSMRAVVA